MEVRTITKRQRVIYFSGREDQEECGLSSETSGPRGREENDSGGLLGEMGTQNSVF